MDDFSAKAVVHTRKSGLHTGGNQIEITKKKNDRLVLLLVLPLIVFACLLLWYMRNDYRVKDMIHVKSDKGVFDLVDIKFSRNFVRLEGEVSYLPDILTPEEFSVQAAKAQSGNPWNIPCATSRIRIKVPDDRTYMVTCAAIDFSSRVYINGELRFQAGVPAETAEEFVPGGGQMMLEVNPENGVIEIIQQGANYVHREGGGHSNLYFGRPDAIKRFLALSFGPEYMIVGLFAVLFLVHFVLFAVRRSYKPNLIFSLLCLTWMLRSGVTGVKVFYALVPSLPWQLAFRVEYLSLPIAAILLVLLAREVFPDVPQKWFVRVVTVVSAGFSVLCLAVNSVFLSWTLLAFEAFFTLAILYLCMRFIMKVPGLVRGGQFQIEQTISLISFGFFMIAAINDAMYHAGILYMLGLTSSFAMTWLAMLIFSVFQMTAMFYGTMRETAQAHEREQRAEAEKEILSEMNRLKSAFYADLSHEMKTPLTVIAVNAQFAAQNMEAGIVDAETVTDLNAISAEAKRLAQMVTSIVGLGRIQGAAGGRDSLALHSLLTETTRIYQTLFARKNNTLSVETETELPVVTGNGDQLIQVLINLLSNANRHTINGAVTLHAEVMESEVKVSVIDNGEGIDPELLPYVFERYRRGEMGGSGLGLAICKSIIEEHGGRIGIESIKGKGTTVWFTLPAKEDIE